MLRAMSCLVVVAAVASAAAAAGLSARFNADLHGSTTPFHADIVTKCFGSSHAATALTADWQAQLAKVRREIGSEYVRFHGLLDDDMSVVLPARRMPHADMTSATQVSHDRVVGANVGKKNGTCVFQAGVDYHDPAGPVVTVGSKEECCAACYSTPTGLPQPCVVAVYAPGPGNSGGKCYLKLSSTQPLNNTGVTSCLTNRRGPRGFMYSWVNIFRVFDFLVSIGMKPVVELSFMPSLLATDPTLTGFWYKGGHSAPKDWDDWQDFMGALAQALVERYGLTEVESWYFEVWNEPNCGFYDTAPCCGPTCGNHTAYTELFVHTFKAIKAAVPSLRVGGPATAQLGWLDTFIEAATAQGAVPDFVTSHLYPTDPFVNHTRQGFAQAIAGAADTVAATAAKLKITRPPLLITEFNCGLGQNCADHQFAGSFVAHQAVNAQATAGQIPFESYWTFSDIFEEQGQQPSEFSQAFGAQSIHGVPKPVYRAMQLLQRLQGQQVAVEADGDGAEFLDCVVTREGSTVEIMVVNHPTGPVQLPPNGTVNMNTTVEVEVTLAGCTLGSDVELRVVDEARSNALPLYRAMGWPAYPNASALAALQAASETRVESARPTQKGNGVVALNITLSPYALAIFSFTLSE